jgi:hypothetical protein
MKPNLELSLLQAKYNLSGGFATNRGVMDDFVGCFFVIPHFKDKTT